MVPDRGACGVPTSDESCPNWARDGGCHQNAGAVLKACGKSCDLETCEDKNSTQCAIWGEEQCAVNPGAMLRECPKTCGMCRNTCHDKDESCKAWADAGECTKNAVAMRRVCPSSCLICANIELAAAQDAEKDEM